MYCVLSYIACDGTDTYILGIPHMHKCYTALYIIKLANLSPITCRLTEHQTTRNYHKLHHILTNNFVKNL